MGVCFLAGLFAFPLCLLTTKARMSLVAAIIANLVTLFFCVGMTLVIIIVYIVSGH
jgi:hypothetical protein